MKKAIVFSILGLAASGFAAFGQGAINFSNYSSASYEPVFYTANAALAPSGMAGMNVNNANVEIQAYYMLGDQTSMSVSSFLAAATAGSTTFITTGANTGGSYMGGGPLGVPTGAKGGPGGYFTAFGQTIPTWSAGDVTFLLTAWDSTGGATYANSLLTGNSGLFVVSDVVTTVPPAPAANTADNPAIMMSVTTVVPEPTTLAFAGMGLFSLLAFARRKKAKA